MSCKKSELVSAINSFTAAILSNDANLKAFSSELLSNTLGRIEFDPEGETAVEGPVEGPVETEVSAES